MFRGLNVTDGTGSDDDVVADVTVVLVLDTGDSKAAAMAVAATAFGEARVCMNPVVATGVD